MHLVFTKNKKTGHEYVYLKESTIDPKTGKSTKRTVKYYGRRDILEKEHPGKLEELQERYKPRARRAYEAQAVSIASESLVDPSLPNEVVHERRGDFFNYGWLVLRWIWNHILHLEQPFTYLNNVKYKYTTNSQGEKDSAFSMNTIASMLVCRKAMGGASILKTYQERCKFLGMPKESLSQLELDRFLGYLEENKDYIVKSLNTQLDKKFGKERYSLLYYDATNTFFETPMSDEERGIDMPDYEEKRGIVMPDYEEKCGIVMPDYEEKRGIGMPDYAEKRGIVMPDYEEKLIELIEEAISDGVLTTDCITDEGLPNYEALPESFMNDIDKRCTKHLRQRGHSKEQRMDLPQVTIVLVIDNYGLPVDYAVVPGNKSEFKTMEPVIQGLKNKYKIEHAIVVADRDLNSTGNLEMLENKGMGYVVAQDLSQLSEEMTNKILSVDKYTDIETSDGHVRRYKVIDTFEQTGTDGKKVECTLVATFDENRCKHDNAILEKNLKILQQKIKEKAKVKASNTGWKALAKIDNSGDAGLVIEVDENAFNKQKALAGHAAFVFKAPKTSDGSVSCENVTADYIAGFYGKLNSIERSFRILKSNIGMGPVFGRKPEHIEAHVLLCFLGLAMLCVLEKILHDAGHMISIDQIIKVLNSMDVTRVNSDKDGERQEPMYLVSKSNDLDTYCFIEPETGKKKDVELSYAQYEILRVLNLSIPPKYISKTGLAGCMRTQFRAPANGGSIYL